MMLENGKQFGFFCDIFDDFVVVLVVFGVCDFYGNFLIILNSLVYFVECFDIDYICQVDFIEINF